jgi:hypothetical protein
MPFGVTLRQQSTRFNEHIHEMALKVHPILLRRGIQACTRCLAGNASMDPEDDELLVLNPRV